MVFVNLHLTYDYTEQEIDRNVDYFEKCMKDNLSGYKALLFFYDYLENPNNIQFRNV